MELGGHVERLRDGLGGGAGLDNAAVESLVWLTLLDVVSAAAGEVTAGLYGGTVEVRLRGRDPVLVVTPPPERPTPSPEPPAARPDEVDDAADVALTRVSLRLPEHLKKRAERSARRSRQSLNAWLVRAVEAAVAEPSRPSGNRYTGWVR